MIIKGSIFRKIEICVMLWKVYPMMKLNTSSFMNGAITVANTMMLLKVCFILAE